jgi:two-component sensor histidine kinase
LKEAFNRLSTSYLKIGVKSDDQSISIDSARALNIFILFMVIISLSTLILGLILGLKPIIYTMMIAFASLIIILYLQYKYYYLLAYYFITIIGCLVILYISYTIAYIGIHFYIISGLAVASVVYLKKRYHIQFFFILAFLTFLGTIWLNKNADNQIDLTPNTQFIWLAINVFISFALVYFSGYFYTKSVLNQRKISKSARLELEKQLLENQLLLKEVNHRVKNNFQIVSSLVEIQSREIDNEQAQQVINEGQKRLKAMALIHQELYQNDDLRINIEAFINSLMENIHIAYASQPISYTLNITPNTTFDIDTSIPLGLIINELITNSFKYAVRPEGSATMNISLYKSSDEYILLISDNGPGIESREDFINSRSVGLKLVKRLVKQLQGSISYETIGGASFQVNFKDSQMRGNID